MPLAFDIPINAQVIGISSTGQPVQFTLQESVPISVSVPIDSATAFGDNTIHIQKELPVDARFTSTIKVKAAYGQDLNNLIDKLMYHTSRPLASRIIGRSHLEGLRNKDMTGYIKHHLQIAGIKDQLFADEAILAIHQGSGGLLRRANLLAKGALIAAANEKCTVVSAEHVRMASTEVI
jgi:RNAse (barnase) inhibitor barstar